MKKQYLLTERAHLMCPNMCFGIAATMDVPYDFKRIKESVAALEVAHPFLRALLGYESDTNRYYYDISQCGKTTIVESLSNSNLPIQERIIRDYNEITKEDFDLRTEGMLKIYSYDDRGSMSILFVFHHLLTDGRGGLGLVREFIDKYVNDLNPNYVEGRLIASMEELPKDSKLPFISQTLIQSCNKNWKKENQMVSYPEYHEFASDYVKKVQVEHKVSVVEKEELWEIVNQCKQAQVTMNDYLMAEMYIEDNTNKIIIAHDIRDKIHCYQSGALGNYATALGVTCKSSEKDLIKLAKIVHKKLKKIFANDKTVMQVLSCYIAMDQGLIDAAAISTLGKFESKAGKFVGGKMFGFQNQSGYSITNLGKIENPSIKSAMFIPPASPAMKKILGVLTVNGIMYKCTSEH